MLKNNFRYLNSDNKAKPDENIDLVLEIRFKRFSKPN